MVSLSNVILPNSINPATLEHQWFYYSTWGWREARKREREKKGQGKKEMEERTDRKIESKKGIR